MKKILILLLVLIVSGCDIQQISEWDGYHKVRLSASGTSPLVDITIKYEDKINGKQTISLNDCTLPFEYPLVVYRGFGNDRVFLYISAKSTDDSGELKTKIEYNRTKGNGYYVLSRTVYPRPSFCSSYKFID